MNGEKLLVKGIVPPSLDRDLTVVGESINRRDGPEKVMGQAKYSGDMTFPNILHGKILRCPYPRAKILSIDSSRAERLPGVKAILTKDNTRGWHTLWYWIPQIALPECITYEGQEVAAVAAEDPTIADKALDLIRVNYEVLTPMLNAEETLKNRRPTPVADEEYPRSDANGTRTCLIERGDLSTGFLDADVIVEDTYTTPTQYHGTIQTRATVASWDGETLTVWDATQAVWGPKEVLAESLGLDPNRVRVIVKYLGGGFGSKAWCQRISFYAARLSIMTRRPVRIELTRRDEFLSHPHRPDVTTHIKMGAKRDGTLTAIYQKSIMNVGAVSTFQAGGFPELVWHTSKLYSCPNVRLEQFNVFTNLQMTGYQRAPLNMPAIFPLESHIDRIAEELGIDALEFRLKNYTVYGDQENRIPYSSKKLDECMRTVAKAIGWEIRRSRFQGKRTRRRGVGMAAFVMPQGVGLRPFEANADIVITNEGKIVLYIGVVEIGGGQHTIFSMIAAEELGVSIRDITVMGGDTKDTRYAPGCHASRCTPEMGPAVLQAAAEARQKLFELAAPMLGVKNEDIASKNGRIYSKSNPSKSVSFKKVCTKIHSSKPLRGCGSRAPNPGTPKFATFGAQAVEVEVDTETGQVRILRMVAAHEVGRAINPKFVASQISGGVEFGVGYALSEQGIYDRETGKMLNTNMHQYGIPTACDFPETKVFIIKDDDPYFAYSAKGCGEGANTPTPAAIRNAIHDAAGIWLNELPMTPDKIIEAIYEKETRA